MSSNAFIEILPDRWGLKRVEEVLAPLSNGKVISQGKSPQCEKEPSMDDEVWGVLKTTAIQPGEFQPEHNKRLPDKLTPDPSIEIKTGDLLLTCAGPRVRCGIPCLVRKTRPRLMMSGKMYRFRPDESILNPYFLEFFLLSPYAQKDIDLMKTGTSESGLNLTHSRFSELGIPVPPLAEQEKIVEILEEQLSRLDAALASVRTVRKKAAQFRRSLLHAAFTGTLTGYETSSDTLPAGWLKTALKDLVEFSPKVPKEVLSDNREVSFVPMSSVAEVLGHVDVKTPITAVEGKRRNLTYFEDGDVIFAKITPCMENGKIARLTGLINGAAFGSTEFHVLRPSKSVNGEYLWYFLVHDDFRDHAERSMTGAVGQRRVPRKYLESYEMTCPPLAEQEKIVEILEEQFSRLDASLVIVDAVEKRSAALRRSLLHAAFTGKLTEQWREGTHV